MANRLILATRSLGLCLLLAGSLFSGESGGQPSANNETKKCEASNITVNRPFKWKVDNEKLSWLKKLEDLASKLPLVKKAELTVSANGNIKEGFECCPDATDPTQYAEYTGGVTGKLELTFKAVGLPTIDVEVTIPLPGNTDLFGIVKTELAVNITGNLTITGDVKGRTGDCSCLKVSGTGTFEPAISLDAKGLVAAGTIDKNGTVSPWFDNDVTGSFSLAPEFSVGGSKGFGSSCPPSATEGPKVCGKFPIATVHFDLKLPFGFKVNYDNTFDLIKYIFKKNEFCYP